ncbi:MAG: hypothetical protein V1701_11655 [Planctomycetota bacterium]
MDDPIIIQPQKAKKTGKIKKGYHGVKYEILSLPRVKIFLSGNDSGVLLILGESDNVANAINKGKVFLAYEYSINNWDAKTNKLKREAKPVYINPFGIRYFRDDPDFFVPPEEGDGKDIILP